MPIVTSTYSTSPVQKCGRVGCEELHTDSDGKVHRVSYLALPNTDFLAVMNSRVAHLNAQLAEADCIAAVFKGAWNHTLRHVTANELATYVRGIYRDGSKEQLAKIAKRILEWITNGRFTDAQIRTVFGLNSAQWGALKTKMQNLVAAYDALESAVGE